MAKTDGSFGARGKVGDNIFRELKSGSHVKPASKEPIKQTDETKKASSDFARANQFASRVHSAFRPFAKKYGDKTFFKLFLQEVLTVQRSVGSEKVGEKYFHEGDFNLLNGFQFSTSTPLSSLLYVLPEITTQDQGFEIKFNQSSIDQLLKSVPKANFACIELQLGLLDLESDATQIFFSQALMVDLSAIHFPGGKLPIATEFKGLQAVLVAIGVGYLNSNGRTSKKTNKAAAFCKALVLKDGVPVTYHPPITDEVKTINENTGIAWEPLGEEDI